MVQHSNAFPSLVALDPALQEVFFQEYEQIPMILAGQILGVRQSTQARETIQRVGSFGEPQAWNGQVYYDTARPDYQIVFAHTHLTLGFKVDQEMFEDMQYSNIFDSAAALGQGFARRRVRDEAAMLQNAFEAGVVGYDGVSLVNAAHPRSQSDATAVSNTLGTVALTEAQLNNAVVRLETLGDDKGQETNAMATHLIVGRELRSTAQKLVGSQLEPESGNNAINTFTGLNLIVHPMITGKKWFVVDAMQARRSALWQNRILPQFNATWDNGDTLVRSFWGRMRYSYGWTDFRWMVGSNAT